MQEKINNNSENIQVSNNKNIRIIQITDDGANELYELLMEELGYITEDEFSKVLDKIEDWINVQCGSLALFYIKSRQNGLVPSNEPTDEIPKNVREIKKGSSIPKNSTLISKFMGMLRRSKSE